MSQLIDLSRSLPNSALLLLCGLLLLDFLKIRSSIFTISFRFVVLNIALRVLSHVFGPLGSSWTHLDHSCSSLLTLLLIHSSRVTIFLHWAVVQGFIIETTKW